MKIDPIKINQAIKESNSYFEVSSKYYGYSNSKTLKKIRKYVFDHAIDISHFCKKTSRKYEVIEKTCPVCGKTFNTLKNFVKEKITCSHSCANTYFRSGEDHGNWNEDTYRTTCFAYHDKKCIICGETNIVAVHHYDGNHENNDPKNLIPMCPTHHQYMHSKFRKTLNDIVDEYYNNYKIKTK